MNVYLEKMMATVMPDVMLAAATAGLFAVLMILICVTILLDKWITSSLQQHRLSLSKRQTFTPKQSVGNFLRPASALRG